MNTFIWICVALYILLVVSMIIVTRGKGFVASWHLFKRDAKARVIALVGIAIPVVEILMVIFPFPGSGVAVLFCTFLLIIPMWLWWRRMWEVNNGATQK